MERETSQVQGKPILLLTSEEDLVIMLSGSDSNDASKVRRLRAVPCAVPLVSSPAQETHGTVLSSALKNELLPSFFLPEQVEFGAHKAVLVRTEDSKVRLPEKIRKSNAFKLTVAQAKGLEFDDGERSRPLL